MKFAVSLTHRFGQTYIYDAAIDISTGPVDLFKSLSEKKLRVNNDMSIRVQRSPVVIVVNSCFFPYGGLNKSTVPGAYRVCKETLGLKCLPPYVLSRN